MTLSISVFSSALQTEFQTKYTGGPDLIKFSDAVATGIVNTSIGLTGQITIPVGVGVSTGVGILSLSSPSITSSIVSTATASFGQAGVSLQDTADAIGNVLVAQFSTNIVLTSDANGACTFTSFAAAITSMASAIQAAESSFTGLQWGNFCTAIATGICTNVGSSGTGILAGAVPPPNGTGVVTIS